MADALCRGYKVALPVGEDWRYDLIVLRKGKLERVQCKYVTSDGSVICVPCRSVNSYAARSYTSGQIDWLAVYDKTTNACYYIPALMLGSGRSGINLRLVPSRNGQQKGVVWAKKFTRW